MGFFKHHWFNIILGCLIAVFVIMLFLIIISPKQDAKGRGFVACTQDLLDDLIFCERRIGCSMKAIAANTWCDVKVITKGAKDWAKGMQQYPWSNYIYEPEKPENQFVDEDARREYLKQYPDTKKEMELKDLLRKELENEQNTIKNNEISWNEDE